MHAHASHDPRYTISNPVFSDVVQERATESADLTRLEARRAETPRANWNCTAGRPDLDEPGSYLVARGLDTLRICLSAISYFLRAGFSSGRTRYVRGSWFCDGCSHLHRVRAALRGGNAKARIPRSWVPVETYRS